MTIGSSKYELGRVRDDDGDGVRKRLKEWDHVFAVHEVGVAEAYRKGWLTIQLVLKSHAAHADHRYVTVTGGLNVLESPNLIPLRTQNPEAGGGNNADGRQEGDVFIEVVELTQLPDATIAGRSIGASFVRSQTRDEIEEPLWRPSQFAFRAAEVSLLEVDRKSGVSVGFVSSGPNRLCCEVIQRGAEIVDGVADDARGFVWKGRADNVEEDSRLITVCMDVNSVWVVYDKIVEQGFEITDVMLCPHDL